MSVNPINIKALWSPRQKALAQIHNLIMARRGGAYKFVHRGSVNWLAFDFNKYPLAATITVDESALFRTAVGLPLVIGIELAAKLPTNPDELDPDLADTLYDDATGVILSLSTSKDSNGDSYILKYSAGLAQAIEFMDVERGVQGLFITCPIEV